MRTDNLKCKITLRFPCEKPDRNNIVYTKKAIEKAVKQLCGSYPIVADNNVVGATHEPYDIIWDEDNNVYLVTINGVLFHGGTACEVNRIEDGVVQDFEIMSFGLSVE